MPPVPRRVLKLALALPLSLLYVAVAVAAIRWVNGIREKAEIVRYVIPDGYPLLRPRMSPFLPLICWPFLSK